MAAPHPSSGLLTARRVLRDEAVARAERRLGVAPEVMPAVGGLASEQLELALSGIDLRHAGWALVGAGTVLVRNCERLPTLTAVTSGAEAPASPSPSAAGDASPSYTAALAWAGLLAAVVGDRLLDRDAPAARPAARPTARPGDRPTARPGGWVPGDVARESRLIGRELAASADASPFIADALDELTENLPGLDPGQAGWALLVIGVWIGANADRIAAPLVRRRLLARRLISNPDEAREGIRLGAALMARIGEVLIARSA